MPKPISRPVAKIKLPAAFERRYAAIKARRAHWNEQTDSDAYMRGSLEEWRALEELYRDAANHESVPGGLLWSMMYDAEQYAKSQIRECVAWLNEFGSTAAK